MVQVALKRGGALCMVLWASTNLLTGANYSEVSDRCSKQICAFCVCAPGASGGSDPLMSKEIVFQKHGAVETFG